MADNDHTTSGDRPARVYCGCGDSIEPDTGAVCGSCEYAGRVALKGEAEVRMRQLVDTHAAIEENLRTKLAEWRSRAQCMSCAEVLLGLRPSCRSHGETPRT